MADAFDIVIVGAGSAGITVAARLRRERPGLSIALFDRAEMHWYQPLWTLVGGGVSTLAETGRPMSSVIPHGCTWIKKNIATFQPESSQVTAEDGSVVTYKYLVVAPGIQINWGAVKGLKESIGQNGVCSNYSEKYAESTWQFIRGLKSGPALFTFPSTPVKCAGAPQKIMYLAEEYFRQHGLRDKVPVEFWSAGAAIFGIPKYRAALEKIVSSRDIRTTFGHDLVEIRGKEKVAVFRKMADGSLVEREFGMIHVCPPMSAPDFIRNSPLASKEGGWVDVDKFSLRHVRYPNVFGIGDASSLPTSRTGAAIRKEAPVLVSHLLATIDNRSSGEKYNGYTSCPLVTGRGKLILAEFDYDGNPAETFPFDQAKERLSMYLLKKYVLPKMYWYGMLKGRA